MTDLEFVDAQRFADLLDTIEEGAEPDLDPREDPTLYALTMLASEIRDVEQFSTGTPRFHSYRRRSRAHVLSSVERPAPAARERRRPAMSFLHWSYLAPVASAAAAVVAVLAFVALQQDSPVAQPAPEQVTVPGPVSEPPPGDATATEPPPAPAEIAPPAIVPPGLELLEPWEAELYGPISIEQELARIDSLITAVADRVASDQPVDLWLLRGITESTALVAQRIEAQPESVTQNHVIAYIKAAADSRTLLATVRAHQADEPALSAARRVAQDGVVVASRYFAGQ